MNRGSESRRGRLKDEVRGDLVAAAHELVREEGYEGLTIRKLAERVGYAPMSVYSYFPDKQAILMALARDAFATLASRMEREVPAEPVAALKKLMRDYAAFAFENPNEYRTVFMSGAPAYDEGIKTDEKQNPALDLLLARVAACVEAGSFKGDVFAIATLLWTAAHGAVSLLLSFPGYPFGDREAYVEKVTAVALAGIDAAPVPALTNSAPC
jgi:AcrR family transcriptional regulator